MHDRFGVYTTDSSFESDDADDNFYAMPDARRRNVGHQWQDNVQRQSRLCVTLSINKGRLLACTFNQVHIASLRLYCTLYKITFVTYIFVLAVSCFPLIL